MTSSDENEMESRKNWKEKENGKLIISGKVETELEKKLMYSQVLFDTDYNFVVILKQRALKRAPNVEIFEEIQKEFSSRLEYEEFIKVNKYNFSVCKPFERLNCDIASLQAKYNYFKREWRKLSDRARNG